MRDIEKVKKGQTFFLPVGLPASECCTVGHTAGFAAGSDSPLSPALLIVNLIVQPSCSDCHSDYVEEQTKDIYICPPVYRRISYTQGRGPGAVSYTHLALPAIVLV